MLQVPPAGPLAGRPTLKASQQEPEDAGFPAAALLAATQGPAESSPPRSGPPARGPSTAPPEATQPKERTAEAGSDPKSASLSQGPPGPRKTPADEPETPGPEEAGPAQAPALAALEAAVASLAAPVLPQLDPGQLLTSLGTPPTCVDPVQAPTVPLLPAFEPAVPPSGPLGPASGQPGNGHGPVPPSMTPPTATGPLPSTAVPDGSAKPAPGQVPAPLPIPAPDPRGETEAWPGKAEPEPAPVAGHPAPAPSPRKVAAPALAPARLQADPQARSPLASGLIGTAEEGAAPAPVPRLALPEMATPAVAPGPSSAQKAVEFASTYRANPLPELQPEGRLAGAVLAGRPTENGPATRDAARSGEPVKPADSAKPVERPHESQQGPAQDSGNGAHTAPGAKDTAPALPRSESLGLQPSQAPAAPSVGGPAASGEAKAAATTWQAPVPGLLQQVDSGIRWMLRTSSPGAELQLHPEALGRVRIELKVEGGEVHARLWASDPKSIPVLQENKAFLEVSLKEQGLNLGSFDLRQHSNQAQHQGPDGQPRGQFWPTDARTGDPRQDAPIGLASAGPKSRRVELIA